MARPQWGGLPEPLREPSAGNEKLAQIRRPTSPQTQRPIQSDTSVRVFPDDGKVYPWVLARPRAGQAYVGTGVPTNGQAGLSRVSVRGVGRSNLMGPVSEAEANGPRRPPTSAVASATSRRVTGHHQGSCRDSLSTHPSRDSPPTTQTPPVPAFPGHRDPTQFNGASIPPGTRRRDKHPSGTTGKEDFGETGAKEHSATEGSRLQRRDNPR